MLGFLNTFSSGGGWIRIPSDTTIDSTLDKKILVVQGNELLRLNTGIFKTNQENVITNIGTAETRLQSASTEDKLKVNGVVKGWCTIGTNGTVYTKYVNNYLEVYGTVTASGSNLLTEKYLINGDFISGITWTKTNVSGKTVQGYNEYERTFSTNNGAVELVCGLKTNWTWNGGADGWEPYDTQHYAGCQVITTLDVSDYNYIYVNYTSNMSEPIKVNDIQGVAITGGMKFDVQNVSAASILIKCTDVSTNPPSYSGSYTGQINPTSETKKVRITKLWATSAEE